MDATAPGAGGFVRRKTVSAHNDATMRTEVSFGESGQMVLDEPAAHGGTGSGPSPLQAVLGAFCGFGAVTFRRTATERRLPSQSADFEAPVTTDILRPPGDPAVRPHFLALRVPSW